MAPQSDPYTKKRDPYLAALLGWLLPGLGHLYIGHYLRGLIFFLLVMGTFTTGLALGNFRNVRWSFERKFHYIAQIGCGGPTLVSTIGQKTIESWRQHVITPNPNGIHDRRERHGTLYTCVAGLLNLLVLVNAAIRAHTGGPPLPVRDEEKT